MSIWLLVGFGGFVGAILRYWLSDLIQSGFIIFPAGTLSESDVKIVFHEHKNSSQN